MKTDVEELGPTRVKLSVAVPFDELKPSIDKAYREVARQIRVPGFRPGRVPAPIIDRRIGRAPVLEQAVNDAIPGLFGKAVEERDVAPLGRPQVEITKLVDGEEFSFTAEVDVRPKFELPDLGELTVTVDDATVTPDDVEEYLGVLRERFASLKAVQRPAAPGDYVTVDLSATVNGTPVEDAQASGLSYEVGSGSLLEGLDDALTGLSAGESTTFRAELAGGKHAGEQADVTVTVHSVRVKDLPGLDDEFAQLASEFDTIGELRADTRRRLERMKRAQQALQARDRAVEVLVGRVDIPLPEGVVAEEVERITSSMRQQVERAGATWEDYLRSVGKSQQQVDAEIDEQARRNVKVGLVLDQLARQEQLEVGETELASFVTQQAERMGMAPDRLARRLVDGGQLGSVAVDLLRDKAVTLLLERVKIRDQSGNEIDYGTLLGSAGAAASDEQAAAGAGEAVTSARGGSEGAAAGDSGDAADAEPTGAASEA